MPRREQRERRRERRQVARSAAAPKFIQKYRGWIFGGAVGTAIIALVTFGVVNSASGEEDFGFTVYSSIHTLGIEDA